MERARLMLIVTMVLGLVTAACAAGVESVTGVVDSTVATTTVASAAESPTMIEALIETTVDAGGAPTTTSSAVVSEATTTTLDAGAAGTFDFDYLMLGAGASFVPLDDPVMVPATEIGWLRPDSIILGVVHPSGEIHAFPADMMAYHHIANTTIAGEPYLVTY